MLSEIVEVNGKLFRYDYENSVVQYIWEADAETLDAEIEWEQEHGSQLYGIGEDGYVVSDTIGLRRENWENPESRQAYLEGWCADLDAESKALMDSFIKYELPYLI